MTEQYFSRLDLPFGDGEYAFQLGWKSVADWERINDRSMMARLNKMIADRSASISDIRSILHMGLVGAGMTPKDATDKVTVYVEQRPPAETFPTALAVVEAFIFGAQAA